MMTPRFLVRPANGLDALVMMDLARREDAAEWDASVEGGLKQLGWSVAWCAQYGEAITVIDTHTTKPVLIGGAQPQSYDLNRILTWMVVAEGGEEWGLVLMKEYREALDGFFRRWPVTECFSDSRNILHHRWLQYLGYELVEEVEWGALSYPFKHFKRGF